MKISARCLIVLRRRQFRQMQWLKWGPILPCYLAFFTTTTVILCTILALLKEEHIGFDELRNETLLLLSAAHYLELVKCALCDTVDRVKETILSNVSRSSVLDIYTRSCPWLTSNFGFYTVLTIPKVKHRNKYVLSARVFFLDVDIVFVRRLVKILGLAKNLPIYGWNSRLSILLTKTVITSPTGFHNLDLTWLCDGYVGKCWTAVKHFDVIFIVLSNLKN